MCKISSLFHDTNFFARFSEGWSFNPFAKLKSQILSQRIKLFKRSFTEQKRRPRVEERKDCFNAWKEDYQCRWNFAKRKRERNNTRRNIGKTVSLESITREHLYIRFALSSNELRDFSWWNLNQTASVTCIGALNKILASRTFPVVYKP